MRTILLNLSVFWGLRLHCITNWFAFVSCDDHQIALHRVYWWWLICITIDSCHWMRHQSKLNVKKKMMKEKWRKKSIDVAFDPLKLFIFIHCFDHSQQFDTILSVIHWQFNFIESIIRNTWGLPFSNLHTTFFQFSHSDKMENEAEEEEKSIPNSKMLWHTICVWNSYYELTKFNSNEMHNIKRTILSPSKEVVSFSSESFFVSLFFFCFLLFTII